MSHGALRVRAFGKVNLGLSILGRRADGYHEIDTTLQTIGVHDTLTVTERPGPLGVRATGEPAPTGRDNLVWRAAAALWGALGRSGEPHGVSISIDKVIPPRAGLGGGSADAAAALRALSLVWRGLVDAARLEAVAGSLGADVPFFLRGGCARGRGRGDLIEPLPDRPSAWVVLVLPPFGVSTAEAYAWFDQADRGSRASVRGESPAGAIVNDLEAVVAARHPEIREIAVALRTAGADPAGMAGSGSTVFGLFGDRAVAEAAARSLDGAGRVVVTRTLGGAAHRRRATPRWVA